MELEKVYWHCCQHLGALSSDQIIVLYGVERLLSKEASLTVLSQDELQKADRMIPTQRLNWMTAHAALRIFCGELLSKKPLEFDFLLTENGKPFLENMPFHFNISHTKHSFLIAFSSNPVGIDVEATASNFELKDVVNYAFSTEEKDYCRNGDDRARFFSIWTAKEAIGKAIGCGLSDQLKDVNVLDFGTQPNGIDGFACRTFFCPNNEIATLAYHPSTTSIRFIQLEDISLF